MPKRYGRRTGRYRRQRRSDQDATADELLSLRCSAVLLFLILLGIVFRHASVPLDWWPLDGGSPPLRACRHQVPRASQAPSFPPEERSASPSDARLEERQGGVEERQWVVGGMEISPVAGTASPHLRRLGATDTPFNGPRLHSS